MTGWGKGTLFAAGIPILVNNGDFSLRGGMMRVVGRGTGVFGQGLLLCVTDAPTVRLLRELHSPPKSRGSRPTQGDDAVHET